MLSSFVLCKYRSQMNTEALQKFIAEVCNFPTGPTLPIFDVVLITPERNSFQVSIPQVTPASLSALRGRCFTQRFPRLRFFDLGKHPE